MPLTPEQSKLSPEELKKDVHLRTAEGILKEVDPSIEFEWVKKGQLHAQVGVRNVGGRRLIQMEG